MNDDDNDDDFFRGRSQDYKESIDQRCALDPSSKSYSERIGHYLTTVSKFFSEWQIYTNMWGDDEVHKMSNVRPTKTLNRF